MKNKTKILGYVLMLSGLAEMVYQYISRADSEKSSVFGLILVSIGLLVHQYGAKSESNSK